MIENIDINRRRTLMAQVARKMHGWQTIWMSSEHDLPCIAKGRYIAAKEFHEWLANGGDLSKAQEYLDERTKHWLNEENTFDGYKLSVQLAQLIKDGHETRESLKGFEAHIFEGFEASAEEVQQMDWLKTQYKASQVELWHLARLLKEKP
jgi:hypothetical protein